MKRIKVLLILVLAIAFFLNSCTCKREPKVPLDKINVEVKVNRFDHTIFSINIDSIDNEIKELENTHSEIFHLFTNGIIGIGMPDDPIFNDFLISFVTDNMVTETYNEVKRVFPNTNDLNLSLTNAFKRYHYYFPERVVPTVYGFVSGFNSSIMLSDSIMGIGLDRYLGRNCKFYTMLGIPKYIQFNMHPKKIPSDLIRAWIFGEFQFNDSIDNLVNNMIYEGQLMYITKRLLPEQPDSLIFGFTPEQMHWCNRNESQMWAHLVEHKYLFSTETFTINQFISGAPFTHAFTNESPGQAAVWLGYRIVNQFMNRNKDYTIEMLMNERDYQSILNRARYNPK